LFLDHEPEMLESLSKAEKTWILG